MNRNSQELRDLLLGIICKQKQDLTGLVSDPQVDFSKNRKLSYENMILSLLTMEGNTLTNELLRQFGCSATTATSSAFVQQRKKLLPTALNGITLNLMPLRGFSEAFFSSDDGKNIESGARK